MRKSAFCIYFVATSLLASGCSFISGDTDMTENMSRDQAAEKVQEHIDGTLTALPEGAELEAREGLLFASCDDPTDGGAKDRVTASETFWVRGLPAEDNEANIDLMYEYWTENGYRTLHDLRPEDNFVTMEHEEDSFRVSVETSNKGSLSLGASSPCVDPDGPS